MAEPCPALPKPDLADYDVWQVTALDWLKMYGECAARHLKTVQAWPK